MNILLLNHYAGSQSHGMEFRPHELARRWVREGHDITIMAGSYSHLRNLNPCTPDSVTEEVVDGVRFRWIPTRRYQGNGIGRALSMVDFLRGLGKESKSYLRRWVPDVVIASSTYPFDIYPARRIAHASGAKLIWEVHDLWPLSLIEIGGYSRWHPFILATQVAEDACCRASDAVVSILPATDRHLVTRGLDPARFFHIPNGVDVGWRPRMGPSTLSSTIVSGATGAKPGAFTLGFAGTLSRTNGLETLFAALSAIDDISIQLLLWGAGPWSAQCRERAERLPQHSVTLHGRVTRAQALDRLCECDAIYVGLEDQPLYRFGIGMNKIFDGMLCERPIIASYSAANDPIGDANCGLRVAAGDVEGLAHAIRRVHGMSPDERNALGAAGGRFVREFHSHDALASRFLEVIRTTRRQHQ